MNKYDINKAYSEVMETIQQIKDTGIKIEISQVSSYENENYKDDKNTLSSEFWKHVTFYPMTNLQRDLIYQHSTKLSEMGILFDSGQGFGGIDWEIDWSLRIEKNQDDVEEHISTNKDIEKIASEHFPLPIVH